MARWSSLSERVLIIAAPGSQWLLLLINFYVPIIFFLSSWLRNSFCCRNATSNHHEMQPDITNTELETLLTLYNQEIEKLKEKLLNGESWENLRPIRSNITELAIAIQKSHGYNVALGGPVSSPYSISPQKTSWTVNDHRNICWGGTAGIATLRRRLNQLF